MSLQDVKTLLEIETSERDDLLNLIIVNAQTQLLARLELDGLIPSVVPDELEYIVTELAVARYNRLGSEGMQSESVEGHSATYRDDDFLAYEGAIERYLNRYRAPKKGVVRFL